ncbi:MAG: hypothetical protein AB8I58_06040, partial [Anaerolineales bacterium]
AQHATHIFGLLLFICVSPNYDSLGISVENIRVWGTRMNSDASLARLIAERLPVLLSIKKYGMGFNHPVEGSFYRLY